MNNARYTSTYCLLIILSIILFKGVKDGIDHNIFLKSSDQAQVIESVPDGMKALRFPIKNSILDSEIMMDDSDKKVVTNTLDVPIVKKPYITAESYLVGNLETGEVYFSFNPQKVHPIASVSKLYTALVVKHLFKLDSPITITQSILDTYGDSSRLQLGEIFAAEELLYSLLLESSNDAAEAFAQSYENNLDIKQNSLNFIKEMNGFAKEIGMNSTSFSDPSGLSPRNVSSVSDLFVLSKYLYHSENDILEISRTNAIKFATTTDHGNHDFININPFVSYTDFIGGKTGRTDWAKEAMVSIFNQKIGDTIYPIAVIILRSDFGEREMNTEKLLGMFIDKKS